LFWKLQNKTASEGDRKQHHIYSVASCFTPQFNYQQQRVLETASATGVGIISSNGGKDFANIWPPAIILPRAPGAGKTMKNSQLRSLSGKPPTQYPQPSPFRCMHHVQAAVSLTPRSTPHARASPAQLNFSPHARFFTPAPLLKYSPSAIFHPHDRDIFSPNPESLRPRTESRHSATDKRALRCLPVSRAHLQREAWAVPSRAHHLPPKFSPGQGTRTSNT
jgi:hypothetical protein